MNCETRFSSQQVSSVPHCPHELWVFEMINKMVTQSNPNLGWTKFKWIGQDWELIATQQYRMYSSCRRLPRQAYMPRRKYSFTLKIRPALLSTEKSHEECLKSQRKLLIIGWALRITENDILISNLRESPYLPPNSSSSATGRRQKLFTCARRHFKSY